MIERIPSTLLSNPQWGDDRLLLVVNHEADGGLPCGCVARIGYLAPELVKSWAFAVPCMNHLEGTAERFREEFVAAQDWFETAARADAVLARVVRELSEAKA